MEETNFRSKSSPESPWKETTGVDTGLQPPVFGYEAQKEDCRKLETNLRPLRWQSCLEEPADPPDDRPASQERMVSVSDWKEERGSRHELPLAPKSP